ncbi:MAG TPA: HAD family hydrolase, partial [Spirochaetota bacterium]|nr:HAD family hydrolase [Spirochaetota bacterium]
MKRKIEAILFDFDGTLANTLPLIFDSFRGLFREFKNQEITPAEVESMFGPTEIGIIKKQFKEKIPEVIEKFYKTYEEKHIDFQHKEEEFIDLLEFIKSKGLKIGIVTGKGRDTLNISLRLLKMDKYFDVLISGDDVQDPKPSPEGIYKALEKINVLPEKT